MLKRSILGFSLATALVFSTTQPYFESKSLIPVSGGIGSEIASVFWDSTGLMTKYVGKAFNLGSEVIQDAGCFMLKHPKFLFASVASYYLGNKFYTWYYAKKDGGPKPTNNGGGTPVINNINFNQK